MGTPGLDPPPPSKLLDDEVDHERVMDEAPFFHDFFCLETCKTVISMVISTASVISPRG